MKQLSQILELRSSKQKVEEAPNFSDLKVGDIMYFAQYIGNENVVEVKSGTILDISSSGRFSFKTGPYKTGSIEMSASKGFEIYTIIEGDFTMEQKVFAFLNIGLNAQWFYTTNFQDLYDVVYKYTHKKIKDKVNK